MTESPQSLSTGTQNVRIDELSQLKRWLIFHELRQRSQYGVKLSRLDTSYRFHQFQFRRTVAGRVPTIRLPSDPEGPEHDGNGTQACR